jgi:hypothetical protein
MVNGDGGNENEAKQTLATYMLQIQSHQIFFFQETDLV